MLVLTLLIAALTGLVVSGFVAFTEHLGKTMVQADAWSRCVTPILGSLIAGVLLYKFFPDARGSGIPQTRVAMLLNNGYISLRTIIGKFLCCSLSLGSGIALGREGPSVQIGAGLASVVGRRLGLSEQGVKSLIPVGTAAAIAAAFNTPLAAVLFTLEEILADLHARVVGSVVLGAATSWIVLRLLLGDEPIFHVPAYRLVHPIEFLIYVFLGLAGGLVSTVFVKLLLYLRAKSLTIPRAYVAFVPALGGVAVGLMALIHPGVLGVGYNLVNDALNGNLTLQTMLLLLVLKTLGTTMSYGSGNAGGIFGPGLFVGAMLGGAVGQAAHFLLPDLTANAGAYALVGMGAAFAGIIRTPMTSVIMIFEITRDYTIIVPLMLANLVSYFVAQKLQHSPIYEALLKQENITMPSGEHRLEPLTVERAMRPVATPMYEGQAIPLIGGDALHLDDSLDTALQVLNRTGRAELPVVSRRGDGQLGVVSIDDVMKAYKERPTSASPVLTASGNWLRSLTVVTVATILIISTLVYWQRTRRESLSKDSYEAGLALVAQGRIDEAVQEFRASLASIPTDNPARVALGLALIESGHLPEARSYLIGAERSEPESGPIKMGLARIQKELGDPQGALRLYQQAIAAKWPDKDEAMRTQAQLDCAKLFYAVKKPREGTLMLLSVIDQSGGDAQSAKAAAELIQASDTPVRAEEAYGLLSDRFPADASVWIKLGEARLANGKESAALEAYQQAEKVSPGDPAAKAGLTRVQAILDIDPSRRGLSLRERGRRWDVILQRVLDATAPCLEASEIDPAKRLVGQRATSMEMLDSKIAVVQALWNKTQAKCKSDAAVSYVLSRL